MANRKNNLLSSVQRTYIRKISLRNYTVLLVGILSKLIFTGYKKETEIIKPQPKAAPTM